MSIRIMDGGGNGRAAFVNSRNQLSVDAVTSDAEAFAAFREQCFQVTGGEVTFTNANEGAMLYLKNTSVDLSYVVNNVFINAGDSTGGSGPFKIKFYRNPTGGTIVDDASAATVSNRNFGSSQTVLQTAYKASGAGKTLTGGDGAIFYTLGTGNRVVIPLPSIVLRPGSSIGLSYTPPTSNTSQVVIINCVFFVQQSNLARQ